MERGQASTEFLLVFSFMLVLILAVVFITQEQASSISLVKSHNEGANAVNQILSAAKDVYSQGEGAKRKILVQIPQGYDPANSYVRDRIINLRVVGSDHSAITEFDVRGTLPSESGGHWVWAISEGNRVRIGDAMLELDKNSIYLLMSSNSTASTSFSMTNIWIRSLDISASAEWNPVDVEMDGLPSSFSLGVDASKSITLDFTSGANATGEYSGQISFIAIDSEGSTETIYVPIIVEVVPYGSLISADIQGPLVTNMLQSPSPAIKMQPLAIFADADDSSTGESTIKGCQIDADNSNNWQNMLPVDGTYDQTTESVVFNYTSGFALGSHVVRAKCTDSEDNIGPTAYYYFEVVESDALGPIVISMNHTEWPTTLSEIVVGGVATDAYTGNSNLESCSVKVDSGNWNVVIPVDGSWNSPTENFTYNVGQLDVGYHTVYYQCTDELGNVGGVYIDSFGIVDVDLMVVLDRSGSMAWYIVNVTNSNSVSASSTGWSWVKSIDVTQKNGDLANITAEIRASAGGCTAYFNATIDGVTVANGSRTSTSYGKVVSSADLSGYDAPYTVDLWLRRSSSGCTVYNRFFALQQPPQKMQAVKDASKNFIDIAGNDIQAGLVSFSTSATTDKTLAMMTSANQATLKAAIDALVPYGSTCLECGLKYAANELVSARARPEANKVIIFLTDGVGNVGDSVDGAVYCRERDITVYTIGFGDDVDDTELTNIALLTGGDYYYAPNVETLTAIFQNIGK
ncbi:MAG: VWA domain-containing protein [Candidatus Micrarchaeota archaeon]